MPIIHKTIIGDKPNKPNYGQKIVIRRYTFNADNKPLGVVYGCFSPFTGKNGHGRLLSEARKQGIEEFVICSPNKKETLDSDRNMFTLQQKVEIAKKGCEDIGYDVLDAFISASNNYLAALTDIAEKWQDRRIVLICGPDRIPVYGKTCDVYDPSNDAEGQECNFEFIGIPDRGDGGVSGTKVRECIRNNDAEGFCQMTGYSPKMWALCRGMAEKNGTLDESQFFLDYKLLEAMEATARKGIQHLYNPGNSMELGQADFIDLLDYLQKQGKLVNGKNFSLTEKSDGAAFRMGIDDEGQFFIEQSYSGPIYDSDTLRSKYEQKYGRSIRLGRGWANMMDKLKADRKTQACLKKVYEKFGAFKINAEIFISELGMEDGEGNMTFVASRYSKDKIGKDGTIVMFMVAGPDGKPLDASNRIIKFMIKNGTSESIKYDDAELNTEQKIELDLGPTIKQIKNNLKELEETLPGSIKEILANTSRKKDDLALKKQVKQAVEEQQGILNAVFEKQLEHYEGKWGPDYEGVVIKLKDGTMLKITSKKFKEFKASHDDSMQHFLFDESFKRDFINYLR